MSYKDKIKTREQIKEFIQTQSDKTFVFTNGCFDILHRGHVEYLEAARKLGDYLIVGLNSDLSVQKLKGKCRPILGVYERASLLAALSSVTLVVVFEEPDPVDLIAYLKPNIHVKGGDYKEKELPEAQTVLNYGGVVEIIPFIKGKSTSSIIAEIVHRYS